MSLVRSRRALLRAAGALGIGWVGIGSARAQAGKASSGGIGAADAPAAASMGNTAPGAAPTVEEVPYVQTPNAVVEAMLRLGEARTGDTLIDLGSGDGRVVITAARLYRIPGLGIEIDDQLVALSRQLARQAGVESLARFQAADLYDTDLAEASLITLYLLPDVNLALRPRLLRLAPGTRIVSHDWDMGDWLPDRSITVPAPGKPVGIRQESQLHRWMVPDQFAGNWRGRLAGERDAFLGLRITQRFQQLSLEWRLEGSPPAGLPRSGRAETRAEGSRVQLPLGDQSLSLLLRRGRIEAELTLPLGEQRKALLQAV